MQEETGCDGFMIGRRAKGNPWIFKEDVYKRQRQSFVMEILILMAIIRKMDSVMNMKNDGQPFCKRN